MDSLPDPTFFLQLSETFIKTARLDWSDEGARLSVLREISSAEMATQPNPILQIAGSDKVDPIPVEATLSLGETNFHAESFDQIGFSTLTDFIGQKGSNSLENFELGVFEKSTGMPAPTASANPLELVFCGFSSAAIPEISDAFPNLDAEAKSITLAALDLLRFLRSQCKDEERVLLVDIANEKTHLFLIDKGGLSGLQSVDVGRHKMYETMAEVLHLHYLGSAIKLFTRSGFDSSEIAPILGDLFVKCIQPVLADKDWKPSRVHISGLVHAQAWFQMAVLQRLSASAFSVDPSILPFSIDESVGGISSMDTEILSKVHSSLTSGDDQAWYIDYIGSLSKSQSIPRREPHGSNPPFPTAHPDRILESATSQQVVVESSTEPDNTEPIPQEQSPYAPPEAHEELPETVTEPVQSVEKEPVTTEQEIEAIPEHLLSDIEEYEGEFEEVDDYGGGTGRAIIKFSLLFLSVAVVVLLVTFVFFPKASEKYLGITPPHVDFEDRNPSSVNPAMIENDGPSSPTREVSETEVALGVQDLQEGRDGTAFGGLYLPTVPSGATVIIGDMAPQVSPIKLPNVEPGTYAITVMKDGYKTQNLSVTIEPKEVLKTDTIYLERLP